MDLTPFVTALRQHLAVAAEAGGEESRALAERLTAPLESAARLTLLDTLSSAVDEITRDLAPGSVELRLRNREPTFVVTPPAPEPAFAAPEPAEPPVPATPPTPPDGDESATARINFRLGEHLKSRIEEAAAQAGLSVNAWLTRAAAAALDTDDRGRGADRRGPSPEPPSWLGGQRYSGWVR
jgi:hypothetical protein